MEERGQTRTQIWRRRQEEAMKNLLCWRRAAERRGPRPGSLTGSRRWRGSAGGDSPAAPEPAGDETQRGAESEKKTEGEGTSQTG